MIKLKSNEAFETFSNVIKEVQAEHKFKEKMEDLAEGTDKFVNKVVANPKVKSVLENEKVKSVLEKVNESRPEFDEKMDKAKDLTIDAAEKGLSSLKKWLQPKEDKIIDDEVCKEDENEINNEYRGDK
jgi:ribosomal protein L17